MSENLTYFLFSVLVRKTHFETIKNLCNILRHQKVHAPHFCAECFNKSQHFEKCAWIQLPACSHQQKQEWRYERWCGNSRPVSLGKIFYQTLEHCLLSCIALFALMVRTFRVHSKRQRSVCIFIQTNCSIFSKQKQPGIFNVFGQVLKLWA